MRLRDLVHNREYLKETKKLLDEKIKLAKSLKDREAQGKQATKRTKKVLTCASQAGERFQSGSLTDKRTILRELGSNFFLKEKNSFFKLKNPSSFLKKGLWAIRGVNDSLEPL